MGGDVSFNLAGKDWLTEPEAAFYCGVSLRKFQMDVPALGIVARRFMGKKLYSKTELFELIEKSQPWSPNGDVRVPEAIVGQSVFPSDLARRLGPQPLRPFKSRKKT